jgi:hypothetical protein
LSIRKTFNAFDPSVLCGTGAVEAALRAADATFSEKPSLPPPEEQAPLHGSLDGRRRLGGAFAIACDRIRPDPAQPRRRFDTEAQQETMTAMDMEHLAAKETEDPASRRRRGAPVSHHRYSTSQATVSLTFRKKDVTTHDILAALDEARLQVCPPTSDGPLAAQ